MNTTRTRISRAGDYRATAPVPVVVFTTIVKWYHLLEEKDNAGIQHENRYLDAFANQHPSLYCPLSWKRNSFDPPSARLDCRHRHHRFLVGASHPRWGSNKV